MSISAISCARSRTSAATSCVPATVSGSSCCAATRATRDPATPGRKAHLAWLRALSFEDACSQATFADYVASVELLMARRVNAAEHARGADPRVASRPGDRPAALLSWDRHAVGRRACAPSSATSRRFPKPALLSGFLGIVPSERTSDTNAGKDRSPKPARRTPAGCSSRPPSTTAMSRASARRSRVAKPARTRASSRSRGAPNAACTSVGRTCTTRVASPPASSRSRARASSQRSSGRPRSLTEQTPITAPGTLPGRARKHEDPPPSQQARDDYYGQPAPPGRARF